jgi:hypothetical protein
MGIKRSLANFNGDYVANTSSAMGIARHDESELLGRCRWFATGVSQDHRFSLVMRIDLAERERYRISVPPSVDECPLLGVKRTWRWLVSMSANDPKRTASVRRTAATFGRDAMIRPNHRREDLWLGHRCA